MACQNKAKNEQKCTCTSTSCPNHGTCCDCVRYHRENGGVPACLKR